MRRLVVLAILILILTQINGCLRGVYSPSARSSMSALPEIIVDYDIDSNLTKFWVKSPIMDYRYEKLTIFVKNATASSSIDDTFTYCIYLAVSYREFDLNVTALTETTFYHFKCHCLIGTDNEMTFHFEYNDDEKTRTEDVPFEDLPWKKVLWIEEL